MEEQSTHTHDHAHCFCCEANERIGRFFRSRGTSEAAGHFRQSRIEFLKGIRKIIDDRIDHIGRAGQRGTHVPVD